MALSASEVAPKSGPLKSNGGEQWATTSKRKT
jgi:hypothetical protein